MLKDRMHQPVWGGWAEERDPTKDPDIRASVKLDSPSRLVKGLLDPAPSGKGRSQEGPASSFPGHRVPKAGGNKGDPDISWCTNSSFVVGPE